MRLLIDADIPFVGDYFTGDYTVRRKPGRAIVAEDLRDVDALIVRSVRYVGADLLDGTAVKFVGSATSGADHLDTRYLTQHNIAYYVAKGCNAPAVVRYVLSVIATLQRAGKLGRQASVGVIGVGCVGHLLAVQLKALGFSVVLYDPPKAENAPNFQTASFDAVLATDCICLHTPLIHEGAYPTYHLINAEVMQRLKSGTVVINAARGAVVDNQAIKVAGQHLLWCLDVWENEPHIDLAVMAQAFIATPHIAGYSIESKRRATERVCRAFCHYLDGACLGLPDCKSVAPRDYNLLNLKEKTKEMQEAPDFSAAKFDFLRQFYSKQTENSLK